MKEIIQKWLGIDMLMEEFSYYEETKRYQEEEKEWEELRIELKKAEESGLVRLMVTSGNYYAPLLARFCELSDKLKKWKDKDFYKEI